MIMEQIEAENAELKTELESLFMGKRDHQKKMKQMQKRHDERCERVVHESQDEMTHIQNKIDDAVNDMCRESDSDQTDEPSS